ncbi:MAG: glutamine-hydrolyzing carbamoyl-phosphate synthase small subunit [Pseudomonadota bacterium]
MSEKETNLPSNSNAALLLADGTVFFGNSFGAENPVYGEICFNTAMTGYQEVLTDPSYNGQIITFTFPHIGNVGCNNEDIETNIAEGAAGLVVREPITNPSNFRSQQHFDVWLKEHKISGISGIDTRALTRYIRKNGAQNAVITKSDNLKQAQAELLKMPSLKGRELAKSVSTKNIYEWNEPRFSEVSKTLSKHVVAIDYGEKLNILRCLVSEGCKVTVVPSQTSAQEILALKPDGVFLSNGPGDPAATGEYAVPVIRNLIDSGLPIFGICLGHQMLALALGGKTEKMQQGHRGANHPVKNLKTGLVEITSQNHGFVVVEDSLPDTVEITHRSLFDNSVEGIKLKDKPVFSVQHHPESSPGPHDSIYLFREFMEMMGAYI